LRVLRHKAKTMYSKQYGGSEKENFTLSVSLLSSGS
jgi:hypothetical protein